jgi:hypothetical protein
MRRKAWIVVALTAIAIGVIAPPASALVTTDVEITVETTFDPNDVDVISSSNIANCTGGSVEDGPANQTFTSFGGVFAGFKIFTCSGGGFVLRLNARFSPDGSVGTWAVVDSTGVFEGLRGNGKLVGVPFDSGITDHYEGTFIFKN